MRRTPPFWMRTDRPVLDAGARSHLMRLRPVLRGLPMTDRRPTGQPRRESSAQPLDAQRGRCAGVHEGGRVIASHDDPQMHPPVRVGLRQRFPCLPSSPPNATGWHCASRGTEAEYRWRHDSCNRSSRRKVSPACRCVRLTRHRQTRTASARSELNRGAARFTVGGGIQ